jgi:hypothetical protein
MMVSLSVNLRKRKSIKELPDARFTASDCSELPGGHIPTAAADFHARYIYLTRFTW